MKNLKSHLLTFFYSALGMLFGSWIAAHWNPTIPEVRADNAISNLISSHEIEIVDSSNRRRILLSAAGGTPGIWFFDSNGKPRLNLGLYEDNQPFIVLNDEQENAVQIFRTFGNGAPVLVMKSNGRDRIVMGLNPNDRSPFFSYVDAKGAKQTLFGKW